MTSKTKRNVYKIGMPIRLVVREWYIQSEFIENSIIDWRSESRRSGLCSSFSNFINELYIFTDLRRMYQQTTKYYEFTWYSLRAQTGVSIAHFPVSSAWHPSSRVFPLASTVCEPYSEKEHHQVFWTRLPNFRLWLSHFGLEMFSWEWGRNSRWKAILTAVRVVVDAG